MYWGVFTMVFIASKDEVRIDHLVEAVFSHFGYEDGDKPVDEREEVPLEVILTGLVKVPRKNSTMTILVNGKAYDVVDKSDIWTHDNSFHGLPRILNSQELVGRAIKVYAEDGGVHFNLYDPLSTPKEVYPVKGIAVTKVRVRNHDIEAGALLSEGIDGRLVDTTGTVIPGPIVSTHPLYTLIEITFPEKGSYVVALGYKSKENVAATVQERFAVFSPEETLSRIANGIVQADEKKKYSSEIAALVSQAILGYAQRDDALRCLISTSPQKHGVAYRQKHLVVISIANPGSTLNAQGYGLMPSGNLPPEAIEVVYPHNSGDTRASMALCYDISKHPDFNACFAVGRKKEEQRAPVAAGKR